MSEPSRLEYGRAVSARTRLGIALDLVRSARGEAASITGQDEIVDEIISSLDEMCVFGQNAARRLQTAIERIP
jgi:hypothetical protein